MDFDLKQAQRKYEKEQKQRLERAQEKARQERLAKEAAKRRQEEIEELQRLRRLEEVAAAEQARLRQEEDARVGDGIQFHRTFLAVPTKGLGDKITLPPSAIAELSSQSALEKGPMFFEISRASSESSSGIRDAQDASDDQAAHGSNGSRRTHAGVMEFTAEEGWAALPPHVWENLNIRSEPGKEAAGPLDPVSVRIRYVRLPKCTYVKLQPEDPDFADLPNHRAVLETKLRGHSALTEGDVVQLSHGGREYAVRVLELRPERQVSLIDTDVETDIMSVESNLSSSVVGRGPVSVAGARTLVQLAVGARVQSAVEPDSYRYFRVDLSADVARSLGPDGTSELAVVAEVASPEGATSGSSKVGEIELYAAPHPHLYPTRADHRWSSLDAGVGSVVMFGEGLVGVGAEEGSEGVSFSVGVFGFRGKSDFTISAEVRPRGGGQPAGKRVGTLSGLAASGQVGDFVQCGNCRESVPAASLMLHEAYCRRHNIACAHPGCGAVLHREERSAHVHCPDCGDGMRVEKLEAHRRARHEALQCECGVSLPVAEMVKHRAHDCPQRIITCRFCGDSIPASGEATSARDRILGLTGHEAVCGSRTAPCDICGRSIMLKELDLHRAAVHEGSLRTTDTSAVPGSPLERSARLAQTRHPDPMDVDIHKAMAAGGSDVSTRGDIDSPRGFKKALDVVCPICQLAVHSERDLSAHFDLVH